jgi:hypothetical protein
MSSLDERGPSPYKEQPAAASYWDEEPVSSSGGQRQISTRTPAGELTASRESRKFRKATSNTGLVLKPRSSILHLF